MAARVRIMEIPSKTGLYRGARYLVIIPLLALPLLIIQGCRQAPDFETRFPGTWERTIEGAGYSFSGSLTFSPEGTFAFTFEGKAPGHTDTEGKWSLVGRDITFLDDSCADPGTYRFLFKDETLSFLPLRDDCGLRKNALTGEWTKRPG